MGVWACFKQGFTSTFRLWMVVALFWLLQVAVSAVAESMVPVSPAGQPPQIPSPRDLGIFLVAMTLYSVGLLIFLGGLLNGLRLSLRGESGVMQQFFGAGMRLFWPLAKWSTLFSSMVLGLFLIFAIAVGITRGIPPLAGLLGCAFFAVSGGFTIFSLYAPIVLAEGTRGAAASLKDSFRFVKTHFWPTLGLLLLTAAFGFLVVLLLLVASLPVGIAAVAKGSAPRIPFWLTTVFNGASAYMWVFITSAFYAYYYGNKEE